MATASTPRTARTRAPKAPAPLTESQMREFFALVKGADSVELKLTVPGDDHRAAIQALGMDPLNAQIRQVYFYDTPDLTLNAAGLVVRSRRIQGKGGDTVVKLRPVQPDELSRELRKNPSVNVEVDAMPGGFVCSASFKGVTGINDPREVAAGNATIKSLFSKDQRMFYREHAPEGLDMNDLLVLGPEVPELDRFGGYDGRPVQRDRQRRARAAVDPGRRAVRQDDVGLAPLGRPEPGRLAPPPPDRVALASSVVAVRPDEEVQAIGPGLEPRPDAPQVVGEPLRGPEGDRVDAEGDDDRLATGPGRVQPVDGRRRVRQHGVVDGDDRRVRPGRRHG